MEFSVVAGIAETIVTGQTEPISDAVIMPPREVSLIRADVSSRSNAQLCRQPEVYNRELSWLDFNWRVLQEALDQRNPLLERMNFLAITASNLDEFFRKRVGGLKRQQAAGTANLRLRGWTPGYQLKKIGKVVREFQALQSHCLREDILPKLNARGIRIVSYRDLTPAQVAELRAFFLRDVFPLLTPLAFDSAHPFPFISNMSLNLAAELKDPQTGDTRLARVKVPPDRARWIRVGREHDYVPLEQVVIHNLDTLFRGIEIIRVHPFRITRNATMVRNEEEADDLLEMISEELQERRFAPVVRLEVSTRLPGHILKLLLREFELRPEDIYRVPDPLGLSDLLALYRMIERPDLKFSAWQPRTPAPFSGLSSARPDEVFQLLKNRDFLLHHPYQSFANTTQMLFLAATRDPKVLAIKHTMYRTSDDSPIVDALISAAEAGKQVAVLVEVKARFDEEQNIHHSKRLEDAGCHVAYGLIGLKAHSKISLIVREESHGLQSYVHIGTGNYHPSTANLYTDLGLLTTDPDIVADVMDLFNYLTGFSQKPEYRRLLVAPINMRQRFLDMIDREIAHALAGRPGRVIAKMNSLADPEIVMRLYKASQSGVKIDLIVRGLCQIRPGIPGKSDNITVISVIGRFLEHHRIFYFANAGEPDYFMGSADWMQRNLDNRVEAIVPVTDPQLQVQLHEILSICLNDYRNAWEMRPDGRYRQRSVREQDAEDNGHITPGRTGTHSVLMYQTDQNSLFH